LKLFNQMIRAVQRHRGMSMALLAGSDLFQGDLADVQRQVQKSLHFIAVFTQDLDPMFVQRDRDNLDNAWNTVRADWQGDDVIDNFELHSHFIEQLHALMNKLIKFLELPLAVDLDKVSDRKESVGAADPYPNRFKHIELLNFAVRQLVIIIEQTARIRGLATYAAAKGDCDLHHDRKLRYAIQCARNSHEKLRHQAERIEGLVGNELPSVKWIKTYELKFSYFLSVVESDILESKPIVVSSHNIFKAASEIIDLYFTIVGEALDVLSVWNDRDLQDWLDRADV
jgi:hypothetical protein